MPASVGFSGGTTLEIITPPTLLKSSPSSVNKLRRRMPHSSSVCSCTVRKRQRWVSFGPSNTPIVMFVFPASRARSMRLGFSCRTHPSGQNGHQDSIILADAQEAVLIQTGGNAFDALPRLIHHDAAAGYIGRVGGKQAQDRLCAVRGREFAIAVDRRQQRDQQRLPRILLAGGDSQRRSFVGQLRGERSVVYVQADPGNNGVLFESEQNAGTFSLIY